MEQGLSRSSGENGDACFPSIADFVAKLGGPKKRVISKVLLSANGLAAVKAMRSIRQWAYKTFADDRVVKFVAMTTPEDLYANAEYVRIADQTEQVPGGTNNNNFANVQLIVDTAERSGAHGVWAGWGHASEDPQLPTKLTEAGIAFLGPPAGPMRDLGDKISSLLIAQAAGVPTAPWSGSDVKLDYATTRCVSSDVQHKACVSTVEEIMACIAKIGLPVMLKASEGGGGKGIRKIVCTEDVADALRMVQGEVPGSPIFVMKMLHSCHHLEVQLLGDMYGDVIALYGRDCSTQRRHQKVIEEGPVQVAPEAVVERMQQDAVRLAKLVGYQGAGTVEYLYSPDTNQYYFLELNPRLQVEHPVTEQITGVNLPAAQLQVALGLPLYRIADIRRLYGEQSYSARVIELDKEHPLPPKGHTIAVRITAENSDNGFKPTSGIIRELSFRSIPNVWAYFSVSSGSSIHEYADSQFGHLFAWGPTREEARRSLVLGLKEVSVKGEIRTPLEFILRLLERDDFKQLRPVHTAWLDAIIADHISGTLSRPSSPTSIAARMLPILCGAVVKAHYLAKQRESAWISSLSRGQVPPSEHLRLTDSVELIYEDVKYALTVSRTGPQEWQLTAPHSRMPEWVADVQTHASNSDGAVQVWLDGASNTCFSLEDSPITADGPLRLVLNGKTYNFVREYDASQLRASTAGRLMRLLIYSCMTAGTWWEDGAHVKAGAAFAEIEVMKMMMQVTSPNAGRFNKAKAEGAILAANEVIATLELDDVHQVKRAKPYDGSFPNLSPPRALHARAHALFRQTQESVRNLLAGFAPRGRAKDYEAALIGKVLQQLTQAELPVLEAREVVASLGSRLHKSLAAPVEELLAGYDAGLAAHAAPVFPGKALLRAIEEFLGGLPEGDQKTQAGVIAPLVSLGNRYEGGIAGHKEQVICNMLREYAKVEGHFQLQRREDVLLSLRDSVSSTEGPGLGAVLAIARSHHAVARKNKLVGLLLESLSQTENHALLEPYRAVLQELSELTGKSSMEVALKARQLLIRYKMPTFGQRQMAVEETMRSAIAQRDAEARLEVLESLSDQNTTLFDVLASLFLHSNADIRRTAAEVYIRRVYNAYQLHSLGAVSAVAGDSDATVRVEWAFQLPHVREQWIASESVDDLFAAMEAARPRADRYGLMGVFSSVSHLEHSLPALLTHFKPPPPPRMSSPAVSPALARAPSPLLPDVAAAAAASNSMHVLNVALVKPDATLTSEALLADLQRVLAAAKESLRRLGIRRVTAMVLSRPGQVPDFYTFKEKTGFKEDAIYRHIEPPLAYHLELKRLRDYEVTLVPTDNKQLHLYRAKAAGGEERLFARALVRKPEVFASGGNQDKSLVDLLLAESERVLVDAMHAIEVQVQASGNGHARAEADGTAKYNHHIFLKILPEAVYEPSKVENIIMLLGSRHGRRLWRLRVGVMEVVLRLSIRGVSTPLRFIITNPSGYSFKLNLYREEKDRTGACHLVSFPPFAPHGPLHGKPTFEPYPRAEPLQRKRYLAQNDGTTYVYDFLDIFRAALEDIWAAYLPGANAHLTAIGSKTPLRRPEHVLHAVELVLDGNTTGDGLKEVTRAPGLNEVGMVAWLLTLYTPEVKEGRQVVLIANDITHHIGSFGPDEDELFRRASVLARARRIPRLYLAANSGARIGLAAEVRDAFRVAWNKPDNPLKGFSYLYLNETEKERLAKTGSVQCRKVDGSEEDRWRITDVIGSEHGLGVENLRGSGAIAGETSRAYDEIFTITLVTGRTVGIGAYLVRLGQRTVQNEGPIILTGAPALNKVLGREVYSSNVQLGGPQIMYSNGVSHLAVNDELKGVTAILQWLSYVPVSRGAPLPQQLPIDPVNRPISFVPTAQPFDPRLMLAGHVDSKSGEWVSGFFDRGSWTETLGGWARTVICGRARLGGLPCACVATETRTMEKVTPADPANPESRETVVQQAGGVWFPDSAFKTAQAIKDFAREDLPLFIFANWRGFSGGMRDMYDEVLKYGSYIVDALRDYTQPVFVYLPPYAELRGGAWVVLDPTINLAFMEMYADETSRGGVLEASGTVEIKYRRRDLIKTMRRLDPVLGELLKQKGPESEKLIAAREDLLLPMYQQVAFVFADLHDTPGRMKAKGAINGILTWSRARQFFYHRLCRRLAEIRVLRRLREALPASANRQDAELLRTVLHNSVPKEAWADDEALTARLSAPEANAEVDAFIQKSKLARAADEIASLAAKDVQGTLVALGAALSKHASEPAIAALLQQLRSLDQSQQPKQQHQPSSTPSPQGPSSSQP